MKKVVLKLDFLDDKTKQKAMKNVSSLTGVDSIAMDMKDKKLTVTGDVDPVTIVAKLRKICHTEIVSVGPAKEPEKKDPAADKKKEEEKKKAEEKKKEEEQKKKAEEARKIAYAAYLNNLNQHQHHQQQQQYPPYYQPQPQQQYYQYNHPPTPYYTKVVQDETPNCVIS